MHHDFASFTSGTHHSCYRRRGRFLGEFRARAARMLASSDLQLIILALLSEKPRHGYEVIKQIEEHSSGVYSPSPGMVYPALTYLEEMGYAASESEGTKRLYRITETGTEHLNKNRASVEETLEQLARFGRRFAQFQKQFAEEENEASADIDSGPGGGIKPEWRQARREFRALRDDLRAALQEKLSASTEERNRVFAILRRAIDEIRGK
jgi:DNA-binding PadR family transcriptional regulator